MISISVLKKLLPLLWGLPLVVLTASLLPSKSAGDDSPEKINLALRRTADRLLRASGDSTSRIPAVEQAAAQVWRVRLEQSFSYEQLPALLQGSFDLYGISLPYEVAVRRCADATIDLGFHQQDVLQDGTVPCAGRDMPGGCHFIEVTFLNEEEAGLPGWAKAGIFLVFAAGLAGIWFFRRQKSVSAPPGAEEGIEWLEFGNSRLDVAGQTLICGGVSQSLTFRETKLLRLFAGNADRLLEREHILRHVWADEGVLVGRSMDVFVSRLRRNWQLTLR